MVIIAIVIICTVVLGFVFSRQFIESYLPSSNDKSTLSRVYSILLPIVAVLLLGFYFWYNRGESESFDAGIELLSHKTEIINKIGGYKSYSIFNTDSLPKETDNPAKFRVELNGVTAIIYLECTMQKDKANNWSIKELKEDSLIKK